MRLSIFKRPPPPPVDSPGLTKLIRVFDSPWPRPPQDLFWGDSTFERVSRDDVDTRTLGRLLAAGMRPRALCVSQSAYNARMFRELAFALGRMKSRPRRVVFPLNPRSFSPQWHLNPQWRFDAEIAAVRAWAAGAEPPEPTAAVAGRPEEYDAHPVWCPLTDLCRVGEFRLVANAKPEGETQRRFRMKQLFLYHYLPPIFPSHPLLRDLAETLAKLGELGIACAVYVTPVNLDAAVRYAGPAFLDFFRANVRAIRSAVRPFEGPGRAAFSDFSDLLHPDAFFHPDETTEHLSAEGRRRLAESITRELLSERLASSVSSVDAGAGVSLESAKDPFHWVPDIYGRSAHKQADVREDAVFLEAAREVVEDGRTLLYYDRLFHLYQAVRDVVRAFPEGELGMAEVGVYKGGSSFFLASVADRLAPGRVRLAAVDTFLGHPASDLDGREGEHVPGMFGEADASEVRTYLARFGFVEVLQGRIQDRGGELAGRRFHLVHLDADLYEPMIHSLRLFAGLLAEGGIMVVDDYRFVTCPGARRAVDEFLSENPLVFHKFDLESGQCLLIKR